MKHVERTIIALLLLALVVLAFAFSALYRQYVAYKPFGEIYGAAREAAKQKCTEEGDAECGKITLIYSIDDDYGEAHKLYILYFSNSPTYTDTANVYQINTFDNSSAPSQVIKLQGDERKGAYVY